ncbi:MAG: PH domain-containing protein [Candidatus Uhrbacteria bacterium]|nr:PH domain-containing protein [Candidatus Uhrbacteria bacterium]
MMTSRTLFTPREGEILIGVIRPSLWTLVWPLVIAALLILFPFVFVFPLLGLGGFGVAIGVISFAMGYIRLRRIRKRWLLGTMFVTNQRIADLVTMGREPVFVSLPWEEVGVIEVERGFIERMVGIGTIKIHAKDGSVTFAVPPVYDPVAVTEFLTEVQCHVTV